MSFISESIKPINSKVVLFQIDIGKTNDFWVTYAAGVWYVNMQGTFFTASSFTSDLPSALGISQVGSVSASGIQLAKVNSPQACIDLDSSFYWEAPTSNLYVHCPSGNDPDLFSMIIGSVYGFRKGGITADYGNLIFQDRLADISNLSISKDPTFFGIMQFNSASAKIINADGEYDLFTRNQNIFGNKARFLIGFDGEDLSEFQQIYEGLIGKIITSEDTLTIEVTDYRKFLETPIPENLFSTTDYPQLHADDINKPIPLLFGKCRNVPILITDRGRSTAITGHYHGKICDTTISSKGISAINAIYINGINKTSASTGESLTLNTITLTTALYTKGDKVTADIDGYKSSVGSTLIENGGIIIRYLLNKSYGIPYTGDFYELSNWFESQAGKICLFINEQKKLIDVIGDITANGIQGDFFIGKNGKYNLKIYNESNPSLQTINRNDIIGTPSIEDDPSEVITTTVIGYNKDFENNTYRFLVDNSFETEVYNKYNIIKQQKFETLCQSSTAAQDYSDNIMSKSKNVQSIFKIEIPSWKVIDRKIGDFIIVYVDRPIKQMYGRVKCEIIGIDYDFNNFIITFTCRIIMLLDNIAYVQSWYYTNENAGIERKSYYNNRYYAITINEI